MVDARRRIGTGEWNALTSQGFWDTNISPNPDQKTRSSDNKQKKKNRTYCIFWPLGGTQSENQRKRREKYKDLARELRKLLKLKLTVLLIVISKLGKIPKDLVKGLENLKIRGKVETIQATTLLWPARILRKVLETWWVAVTQIPVKD